MWEHDNQQDWYSPTPQERREYYLTHERALTHTYCKPCYNILEQKIEAEN